MQYMLLIYEDESVYGEEPDSPAVTDIIQRHIAFGDDIGEARQGGAGLLPTSMATTVVTRSGAQTIHDGPFAETREQLGGFYLIEAPDLDAAIAIAKKLPLHADGSIEIRPVLGDTD
ncbi:YciI family protein [Sphingomonas sp. QA11]|uniref:YciI family protein n=1 Tax=Sphingomonas sp. QA11 TaxID=2950605 RepID=UPI00234A10F0|nr:YciI family protein [Sphingomonas sp. QA11]WCM28177.1 YciI family protein [Sphingomonas sp. QA11]